MMRNTGNEATLNVRHTVADCYGVEFTMSGLSWNEAAELASNLESLRVKFSKYFVEEYR